jgi:polysaccharide biosynthesis transport protein
MQTPPRRDDAAAGRPLAARRPGKQNELAEPASEELALRNPYVYNRPADDDELDLREFLRKVRRHQWMLISIVVITTTLAAMVMLKMKNTYTATTILEIGKENSTIIKSAELTLENEDSDQAMMTNLKTKLVMFKSHELLEDVVATLRLDQDEKFIEQMRRNRGLQIFGKKSEEDELAEGGEDSGTMPATGGGPRTAEERKRLSPFVEELEKSLNIEQVRETRALKVAFTHTDPKTAAAVSDAVAQSFIQRNYQGKTERFTNAQAWLDRSTAELKAKVERSEQALANYTRENGIFTTEGKSTLTTEKLARLHDQVTRAETDRILKETLYDEVRLGRVAQVPEAFAEMTARVNSQDPKIVQLQKKFEELAATDAKMSVKYGPENPQLQEVREQMTAIKAQIEESRRALEAKLKIEYEHITRDEQSLKAALVRAKAEAINENQAAITYNILNQDVETTRALYTEFLQKANQSRIQLAEQHSNIRVLDHAKVPQKPSGPKRLLIIAACFFVSLVLGLGLVFLREALDNTIKNTEDVARFAQLPLLAIVPNLKADPKVQMMETFRQIRDDFTGGMFKDAKQQAFSQPRQPAFSAASESFLTLRTSMLLSTAGGPPRTILVTSGEPGDGKTTTAINTAISLTQIGASVLLIDADMRRPSVHKVFNAENNAGLSTYLSSKVMLANLIQSLNIPSLSLLPSGPTPPNPANLIGSEKMHKMLDVLTQHYDYVVIDSPPMISIADAVILSTIVDGVVIVVRSGKSSQEVVRRARHELTGVGSNIIGVVLNGLNLKREGYYGYQYYKYYSSSK